MGRGREVLVPSSSHVTKRDIRGAIKTLKALSHILPEEARDRYAVGMVYLEEELKGNYPEGNLLQRAANFWSAIQESKKLARTQREQQALEERERIRINSEREDERIRQLDKQALEELVEEEVSRINAKRRKQAEEAEKARKEKDEYIKEHQLGSVPSLESQAGWRICYPEFPEGTKWATQHLSRGNGEFYRINAYLRGHSTQTKIDLRINGQFSTNDDPLIEAVVHCETVYNSSVENTKTYVLRNGGVIELSNKSPDKTYLRPGVINYDSGRQLELDEVTPILPKASEPEYSI